ncbi:dihydrolipoyllysine-residue acetyltransferase [Oceanicoccus sagamiensis]|uniref:Acetyltransferase component of pyruvate dehydrogenase complex n=1 Tax=Oceanicoccus sagamiensis TaxID=716816 RepID=A0A1X9NDT5_9GAMM|nr:dihydrolipoyllysine-residue acetyltransferase [Oceanicoccus sagamiensis]ARN75321.1 dihydrolipoyllysine-residue acetyltransferase [Oceanicoccus sagamiensis]
MSKEIIKVPDIGGAEGVDVVEICVAIGDTVEKEDSLVVLESDKASMEVPSPMAGKVLAISIKDGDSLSEGDVILELETDSAEQAEPAEAPVVAEESAVVAEPEPEAPAPAPAPVATKTSTQTINVPDIGGGENVDVIEVCVAAGDDIADGDSLIVLETDKASMEVPAPMAGKVASVSIKEGDTVSEGDQILTLEVSAGAAPVAAPVEKAAPVAAPEPAAASAPSTEIPKPDFAPSEQAQVPAATKSKGDAVYAGPAVRRLAREMGVELEQVKGSGPKSRISKDDLKAHVKAALTSKSTTGGAGIPAIPEVDFSKFGEVTVEPLSKIAKVTAHNMQRNWLNIPHVTQFDDADISDLEDFRQSLKAEAEKRGVKITPLPFLLKACAAALRDNPRFNASLSADGENLMYKQYIHIGMAVDTPAGLVVPVIRDVDKKSIWDLAAETVELASKAKERKLKPAEMQGGCFTISSLGGIGGQGFTPIVNAPEVAILGVSKLTTKPVWDGEAFVPRKMLPLSLSYDHRAINGGDGGRFFTYLTAVLGDIRRLVL